MYRYVKVDPKEVSKIEGEIFWVPMALIRFPQCRKETFLIDCFFSDLLKNEFVRVFLLKRAPKKMELVDEPPVQAPILKPRRCSSAEILEDFRNAYLKLSMSQLEGIDVLIDKLVRAKDVEVKFGFFWRRKVVIPAKRIVESSRKIAIESASAVLKGLCIDRYPFQEVEFQPVYVLAIADRALHVVGLMIGKKFERSYSHEAIIFGFDEVYKELFPNQHGYNE